MLGAKDMVRLSRLMENPVHKHRGVGERGQQEKLGQMSRMEVILPGLQAVCGVMIGDEVRYE